MNHSNKSAKDVMLRGGSCWNHMTGPSSKVVGRLYIGGHHHYGREP